LYALGDGSIHLQAYSLSKNEKKENTTHFGVSLMRSQVLCLQTEEADEGEGWQKEEEMKCNTQQREAICPENLAAM
jgi:hypothetical protein